MRTNRIIAVGIVLAASVALLATAPGPASAGTGRLGIDVSRFNGSIDWERVAGAGVRFAFIAASRGSGEDCAVVASSCGADPNYAGNYAAARSVGIKVGPYHRAFAQGANRAELQADARAEADVFITSVGALKGKDLAPALDVESPFDVAGSNGLRIWVRAWLKRVRKQLGRRPLIYTNATSWAATGGTMEFARKGHALWVANWGIVKPAVPAGNWAGRGWSIWQYTSSGTIPGISGRVDLNRLRVRFGKIR